MEKPKVNQDCTVGIGGDRYPYRISRVSASGKTIWIRPLDNDLSEYPNATAVYRAHISKNGHWRVSNSCMYVSIGKAVYYQDPSF
jgi:hypothetical protein